MDVKYGQRFKGEYAMEALRGVIEGFGEALPSKNIDCTRIMCGGWWEKLPGGRLSQTGAEKATFQINYPLIRIILIAFARKKTKC